MSTSPILCCRAPEREDEALELAARLGWPLVTGDEEPPPGARLALVMTPERLELQQLGRGAPGPVFVDFGDGRAQHRSRGQRDSALARAVGARKGKPSVLDATAGLGRDAFVLATLGCRVRALERNPAVFALLDDALRRGRQDPELQPILERLHCQRSEAKLVLQALRGGTDLPDVVLLDPMFPPRRKQAALVKKEMRVCRMLTGDDEDAAELLPLALAVARNRVVIKRPGGATPLGGHKPDASFGGHHLLRPAPVPANDLPNAQFVSERSLSPPQKFR